MTSDTADPKRPSNTLRALLVLVTLTGLLVTGALLGGQRLPAPSAPADAPAAVATPTPPAPTPLDPDTLTTRIADTIVTLTAEAGAVTTAGTGIVLTADGLVLTNHHVIDGATTVTAVPLATGTRHDAEVLGYDRFRDVALVRLDGATDLPVAPLGSSAGLHVRDTVTAIGNADGGGIAVPATGVVTALGESVVARNSGDGTRNRLTGMIEVDADIRPGDSGGPLVDAYGQVVGINTAGNTGMRPDPTAQTTGTAVPVESYALPIDDAVAIAEQIRSGRGTDTVHIGPTALLGLAVTDLGQTQNGAKVVAVGYGSPAEEAGVARGDVVVSWDGRPIRSQTDLAVEMNSRKPGDRIELGWLDGDGRQRTAALILATGTP